MVIRVAMPSCRFIYQSRKRYGAGLAARELRRRRAHHIKAIALHVRYIVLSLSSMAKHSLYNATS